MCLVGRERGGEMDVVRAKQQLFHILCLKRNHTLCMICSSEACTAS